MINKNMENLEYKIMEYEMAKGYVSEEKSREVIIDASSKDDEVEVLRSPPKTASDVIMILDDRERGVEDFVSIYGLGALVHLFNELSDEICRNDGRIEKGIKKEILDWYNAAAKSIKYHYAVGATGSSNHRGSR